MEVIKIHTIKLNQDDIKDTIIAFLLDKKAISNEEMQSFKFEKSIKYNIKETGCVDEGNYKRTVESIEINL